MAAPQPVRVVAGVNSVNDILLVATYELGHQPLSLAWPAAALTAAGYAPVVVDTAVDELTDTAIGSARVIAVATPMQTALRLAIPLLRRMRALNPTTHLVAYGLYAGLNADYLLGQGLVDQVLSGEVEEHLVALVGQVMATGGLLVGPTMPTNRPVPPVRPGGPTSRPARSMVPSAHLERQSLPLPQRQGLPGLERYARLEWQGGVHLVGVAESSRGCRHTCRHCPLTPVYGGRFFAVPVATVLADIHQQVAAGARHITFGDPDFLNGPTHALRVARALQAELPGITFDATIKVEHIVRHAAIFPELRRLGCLFVVSAVESLSDEVLQRLDKGHSRADVFAALAILDAADIALRPSLLPFTPWATLDDYRQLLDWIIREDLVESVDPVHLTIRLLLPPGSPLVEAADADRWLGALEPANFGYSWRHPDQRMDHLQSAVAALVARDERAVVPASETLLAIRRLAAEYAGATWPAPRVARARPMPPRLTEHWFC